MVPLSVKLLLVKLPVSDHLNISLTSRVIVCWRFHCIGKTNLICTILLILFQPEAGTLSSRFQGLHIDDDDEDPAAVVDEDEDDLMLTAKSAQKKKKEKKKKGTGEDNDNTASAMDGLRTEKPEDSLDADLDIDNLTVSSSKKSKKKKKEKKLYDPDDDLDLEEPKTTEVIPSDKKTVATGDSIDNDSEPVIKTAAQKRAEKKEREKKKKEAEKARAKATKAKKETGDKENEEETKTEEQEIAVEKLTGKLVWVFSNNYM